MTTIQLPEGSSQGHGTHTEQGSKTGTPGSRTRTIGLLSGLVLLLALIAPISRAAAAPAPTAGPTAGGTEVSDLVPGVKFTQVAAGSGHSVALSADGGVYTWGSNSDGQLGDGTTKSRLTPRKIAMPDGVTATQVAAAVWNTAAVGSDGNLYMWGINQYGQIGDGTWAGGQDDDHLVPTRAKTPAGVKIAHVSTSGAHTIALDTNGNAYAWGLADEGQLGNGNGGHGSVLMVFQSPSKVIMPEGVHFTRVRAGGTATIAMGSDGNAWFWGALGNETEAGRNKPEQLPIPNGAHPTDVSVGNGYALIATTDGLTYEMGRDLSDSSATSTPAGRWSWEKEKFPTGVHATQVIIQDPTFWALGSDGNVYGWGQNDVGQIGDGTTQTRNSPTKASTPPGVSFTQISGLEAHALARSSQGILYAWGANDSGQLGDGTTTNRSVPGPVKSTATVDAVLFGTTPGTGLSQSGDKWTVKTPAGCGVVDVTVKFTQDGTEHSVVTKNGFTFGSAPVVTTQPKATSVAKGDSVTLTAAATGDKSATVQWQQASSADGKWADIDGATDTSTKLSPTDTTFVRAVFSNCVGTATSEVAKVSVNAVTPTPTPTPSATPSGDASSPATGGAGGSGGTPEASAGSPAGGSQVSTSGTTDGPAAGAAGVVLIIAVAAAIAAGYSTKRRIRN